MDQEVKGMKMGEMCFVGHLRSQEEERLAPTLKATKFCAQIHASTLIFDDRGNRNVGAEIDKITVVAASTS